MQNINLYQPAHQASSGPQSRQMLMLAVVLLVALLAHALWYSVQLWRMDSPLLQAEQRALQAEQALEAMLAGFVEPQLDPQLPLQLAREEADNQQLQRLAEHLQMLARQQRMGFFAPLQALSERHPPAGLWLSAIVMQQGGEQLSLDGYTKDQQLLPQYLHSLGQSEVFRGREFARFDIRREPSGVLQFRLASQAMEAKDE